MRHPLVWASLLLAGCYGKSQLSAKVSGPSAPGDLPALPGAPGSTGPGAPGACTPGALSPGPTPLRRLTRVEYDNTVHDLLGDTTQPANGFVADLKVDGFDNNASVLAVSAPLAQNYLDAAEALAATAVQSLNGLLACDPVAVGQDPCAALFIQSFGKRAYRRPLTADETQRLTALYQSAKTRWTYPDAIRLLVQAILQSPNFLYRADFGAPAGPGQAVVPLSSYERATRLSYLLWATTPDAALMAAADADALSTPDQVEAQARRLLADPRARPAVWNFHQLWLGLDTLSSVTRDPTVYSSFSPTLLPLFSQETQAFVEHVVFDDDGRLETLLLAPYTFANGTLAGYYGLPGVTGSAFVQVPVGASRGGGLLTQASLLTQYADFNQDSPVKRGKLVRLQWLCQALPPPPGNVPQAPPPPDPNATTRQKFAQHSSNPLCAGCHVLMDPIGFGFEHFDAVGQYRTTDHGLPVDATGQLTGTTDADGPFDGVGALSARLAASEQVSACVVTQWFRYAQGRTETPEDACTLSGLTQAFDGAHHDLRELLVALTRSDAFLYRKVGP